MDLKTYFSQRDLSQSEFAKGLGVPPALISQWKTGDRQVPAERCPDIERLTDGLVRCEDLRPDVDWAYLRGTS
jgi:DNA-binding transcriptional regulator YdaS (Cro superfamily)